MMPDKDHGTVVEINREILAFVLGEKDEVVEGVLEKMCAPDPRSRSKQEEGRKLVQIGQYGYRVVNGAEYRKIRDDEERRNYQANWQATKRMIEKAVKSGQELDLTTLTPAEVKKYQEAKKREKSRRTKMVEKQGEIAGATEAVIGGLAEAQAKLDRENAEAEKHDDRDGGPS